MEKRNVTFVTLNMNQKLACEHCDFETTEKKRLTQHKNRKHK